MSKNKNRNRYSGYGKPTQTFGNSETEEKEEQKDAILSVPSKDAEEDPIEEAIEEAIEKVTDISEKEPRIPTIAKDVPFLSGGQRKVKSKKLRLRNKPSQVGDILTLLDQNAIITIDTSFKDDIWCKVVGESGSELGYVMKEFLSPYA